MPIYVDEDCHTLVDIAECAQRAHGINVKLAKSGGIREAVRMVHAARALGLGCMLGCMVEERASGSLPRRRSRSCSTTSTSTRTLLLAHDPWPGDAVRRQCPNCRLDAPGLGVASERDEYLVLAEGFSSDVHYAKTMRGVLRYRRDDVVAMTSTRRAPARTRKECRSSQPSRKRCRTGPRLRWSVS